MNAYVTVYAIKSGKLYAWGHNTGSAYRCGNGTTAANVTSPGLVLVPSGWEGATPTDIAPLAYENSTPGVMALFNNGGVAAWGGPCATVGNGTRIGQTNITLDRPEPIVFA